MPKDPKLLLTEAKDLVRKTESDVNTAKVHAQSDWSFVWAKLSEAETKLKRLQSTLEDLSRSL